MLLSVGDYGGRLGVAAALRAAPSPTPSSASAPAVTPTAIEGGDHDSGGLYGVSSHLPDAPAAKANDALLGQLQDVFPTLISHLSGATASRAPVAAGKGSLSQADTEFLQILSARYPTLTVQLSQKDATPAPAPSKSDSSETTQLNELQSVLAAYAAIAPRAHQA